MRKTLVFLLAFLIVSCAPAPVPATATPTPTLTPPPTATATATPLPEWGHPSNTDDAVMQSASAVFPPSLHAVFAEGEMEIFFEDGTSLRGTLEEQKIGEDTFFFLRTDDGLAAYYPGSGDWFEPLTRVEGSALYRMGERTLAEMDGALVEGLPAEEVFSSQKFAEEVEEAFGGEVMAYETQDFETVVEVDGNGVLVDGVEMTPELMEAIKNGETEGRRLMYFDTDTNEWKDVTSETIKNGDLVKKRRHLLVYNEETGEWEKVPESGFDEQLQTKVKGEFVEFVNETLGLEIAFDENDPDAGFNEAMEEWRKAIDVDEYAPYLNGWPMNQTVIFSGDSLLLGSKWVWNNGKLYKVIFLTSYGLLDEDTGEYKIVPEQVAQVDEDGKVHQMTYFAVANVDYNHTDDDNDSEHEGDWYIVPRGDFDNWMKILNTPGIVGNFNINAGKWGEEFRIWKFFEDMFGDDYIEEYYFSERRSFPDRRSSEVRSICSFNSGI